MTSLVFRNMDTADVFYTEESEYVPRIGERVRIAGVASITIWRVCDVMYNFGALSKNVFVYICPQEG